MQRAFNTVEVALADGDLVLARRLVDDAVSVGTGWHLVVALSARARVAIAESNRDEAQCDAHDALACAAGCGAYQPLAGILNASPTWPATRITYKRRDSLVRRMRSGSARAWCGSKIHQSGYDTSVTALRESMDEKDFDAAWAEGAALSTEEAIAYAQRGRGERKGPNSGWESLTPAEREVVRLVCDGLPNKDIATRLFVSPRTVHAHLAHVYTKLGLSSRVQLVREAAKHA